jgi:hypothetical protein
LKFPEVNPKQKANGSSRTKRHDAIYYEINQSILGEKIGFGKIKSIEGKKKNPLRLTTTRLVSFTSLYQERYRQGKRMLSSIAFPDSWM